MHTIAEILSGQGGLAEVQQLLSGVETQRLLRRALATLAEQPDRIGVCRLQRAKLKPHRKLTAYYDLALASPTGGETMRPLAVTWTPPVGSTATNPPDEWQPLQADAVARQLAAPFHGLMMNTPAQGLKLELSPLDARYPHLVRLSDPHYVRDLLAGCQGHGQPAQVARGYRVRTIRYRPGQRHVLRYDPLDALPPGGPRPVFAKLYREASQQQLFPVINQVADWLAGTAPDLLAPRPLACVTEDQVMLYPWVDGEPLSRHLGQVKRSLTAHLQRTGVALRTLHGIPIALLAGLPTHDFATEVKSIARTCEQIQLLLPSVGNRVHTLLQRAQTGYDRLPQDSPVLVHGDFKADHVLVTASHLTLIDFDSCALADPAYDIGKFLADLAWWCANDPLATLTEVQRSFLAGYGLDPAHPRVQRALCWAVLIQVKIAAHRIPLFDVDWIARTTARIEQAASVLERIAQPF